MNANEIRTKYPTYRVKHDPKPDCKFCHGMGEVRTGYPSIPMRPCLCTVMDHAYAEMVQETLNAQSKDCLN